MIFKADPRYAGRLFGDQGDNIIVSMERVRKAIDFNVRFTFK